MTIQSRARKISQEIFRCLPLTLTDNEYNTLERIIAEGVQQATRDAYDAGRELQRKEDAAKGPRMLSPSWNKRP